MAQTKQDGPTLDDVIEQLKRIEVRPDEMKQQE
jgi:hypothetical protein